MINLCDLFDWLVPAGGAWIHGSMGRKWHILRVRALVPNSHAKRTNPPSLGAWHGYDVFLHPWTFLRLVRSRRRNHIVTMNDFVRPI